MSCSSSNNSNQIITLYSYAAATDCGCTDCGCEGRETDSKCVYYTGPNLPCASIQTNETLEDILIKVDQKLCSVSGDYAGYNTACLDDGAAITSEQQFVEAISDYACTLRTDLDTFTTVTYPAYQTTLNNRFALIESPNLTCISASIVSSDTLAQVYAKYCTKFADIDTKLSLTGVAWDSCYTVNPDPVSIAEGFNTLIGQICDLKTQIGNTSPSSLTFNNVGSCLGGTLTEADSLSDTVNKIKDRLCLSPTFDINSLTWNCIVKPSVIATDLNAAVQALLTKIDSLSANSPTFSADFTVALTDPESTCAGKTISLAPSSVVDKYVAVDGTDGTPGTLTQKLEAGDNVTFDIVTTPGKLIINSTGGSGDNDKVKSSASDTAAGYLSDKLEGSIGSTGITTTIQDNGVTDKTTVSASINFATFLTQLYAYFDANPSAAAAFCERATACLPDCVIPPNVTVIYQDTNQTTTSTTTTTTTTTA